MSGVVVVQVGQCGNQLGEALFSRLHEEVLCSRSEASSVDLLHRFFTPGEGGVRVANAVLVDMEQKVVGRAPPSPLWRYHPGARVSGSKGSGNNWANGYLHYGGTFSDQLETAIRSITDKMLSISCCVILMSSAGGTGSGLGCRVAELVREVVPGVVVCCVVVLPFSRGEVAVQSYNTLLSLACLYQTADMVVLAPNDQYAGLARRLLSQGSPDRVSFSQLNTLLAGHLAGLALPCYTVDGTLLQLDRVVEHLVPHPAYKLVSLTAMPVVSEYSRAFTSPSWDLLGKYSHQMFLQHSLLDEGLHWRTRTTNPALSTLLVCRGSGGPVPEVEDQHRAAAPRFLAAYSATPFSGLSCSVTVAANAAKNTLPLPGLLDEAWTKLQAGAFLHQYEEHGLGRDRFRESFNVMDKVLRDYKEL